MIVSLLLLYHFGFSLNSVKVNRWIMIQEKESPHKLWYYLSYSKAHMSCCISGVSCECVHVCVDFESWTELSADNPACG